MEILWKGKDSAEFRANRQKLCGNCLSKKFPHPGIRWNNGILCSETFRKKVVRICSFDCFFFHNLVMKGNKGRPITIFILKYFCYEHSPLLFCCFFHECYWYFSVIFLSYSLLYNFRLLSLVQVLHTFFKLFNEFICFQNVFFLKKPEHTLC